MDRCVPVTSPSLPNSFFSSQENVKSAIYLIETDGSKNPSQMTYGARDIAYLPNGDF